MHIELYSRLGFDDNKATSEQIKKAYRRLAMDYHPDRFPDDEVKKDIFLKLTEAYEILMNEDKRKEYDKSGTILSNNEERGMRQAAINNIINTFTQLLEKIPEDIVETVEVKDLLIENLEANRNNLQKEVDSRESIIRKLEKSLKRFTKKEGDDILTAGSVKFINIKKQELIEISKAMKILDIMEDMLNNYDYEVLQRMQEPTSNNMMNVPFGGFVIRMGV